MSQTDLVHAILDHQLWQLLSPEDIVARINEISSIVGPEFDFLACRRYSSGLSIPTFRHKPSGVQFNLLPGGSFVMGLSTTEIEEAKQLPEIREDLLRSLPTSETVQVNPFLMSRFPLSDAFVREHVSVDDDFFRPEFGDSEETCPIYVRRSEADEVLGKFGFQYPSEAQWEYSVRGLTRSLFYFGSRLPEEEVLSRILATQFDEQVVNDPLAMNPFGLYGTLIGSWCQERYYQRKSRGPFAIRGCGAIFWPWQNTGEWMMCMSAMRISSDDLEDETCGVQVVLPVSSSA